MSALPQPLYQEVTSVLARAGRDDLVARLEKHGRHEETLTSGQAAALLGVSSANTVKNWLASGQFPGAFKTAGGHWRFLRSEVEAVKDRMEELREKNERGDLTPPDDGDAEYPPPPLL